MFIVQSNFEESVIIILKTEEVSKNNTSASMFGGNSGGSGFTFGTQTPSTQGAPASSSTSTPLGGGFSFGQKPAAPGTSAPPFSLGGQPQSSTPAQGGFSFGSSATPASATPGGFSFGQNPGSVPQATPSTQPNAPASTGTQLGGLAGFAMGKMPTASIGTPAAAPVGASAAPTGTTGLTLGATLGTAGAGFSLTGQPAAATKPVGISLGTTQATSTAGPTLGTLGTAASTTITGNPLRTASSGGGITFGTQKTTAAPTLGSLIGGATTAASTTQSTLGFPTPVAATSSLAVSSAAGVTVAAASAGSKMSYQQLEENINKWMSELEKQEQDFLELATQVNAWDRLLVENGEKITTLNSDMERVKVDQQKLDYELDFIHSQQRELEELLAPLEKAVEQQPNINIQQHSALERENTYQLAENIDAQLKRMLSDLKEIIDHLNSSNTNQDQTDPIQQITKILNSHMDSLQWIDQNSTLLGRKVDEISKQMEVQKREQERNFRLVYN